MKKVLATMLALVMALSLCTVAFAAGEDCTAADCQHVAAIGNTHYATLADAIADVPNNGTEPTEIVLLNNAVGGVKVGNENDQQKSKNIIIDLNNHVYSVEQGVGSTGTETNGMQLLLGSTVVIKNGTMQVAAGTNIKFLIKNYCNLTLENVIVDGTNVNSGETTINNCGQMTIRGTADKMKVTAPTNGFAVTTGNYVRGVKTHTYIEGGTIDSVYTEGTFWSASGNTDKENSTASTSITGGKIGEVGITYWGEKDLKWSFDVTDDSIIEEVKDFEAKAGTGYYVSLQEAAAAAGANGTIKLLNDAAVDGADLGNLTVDLNGYRLRVNSLGGNGTLTIKDSAGNGDIMVDSEVSNRVVPAPGNKLVYRGDGVYTLEKTSSTTYYYKNPTTTTDNTTKGSPKTFDAGIALYAGMALTSLTGMAYVGKKKF